MFLCEAGDQHLQKNHHEGIGGGYPGILGFPDTVILLDVNRQNDPHQRSADFHQSKGAHHAREGFVSQSFGDHPQLIAQAVMVSIWIALQGFFEEENSQ